MKLRPSAFDVTVVEPGNVKTDFTASRRTVEPAAGRSEYVAASTKAIRKMAQDEAKGVPSATIAVDSGQGAVGQASPSSSLSRFG